MNPEQQRIAIAEWCGWKFSEPNEIGFRCWHSPDGRPLCGAILPDYLNDLNAMREAEEVLEIRGTGDKGHPSIPNDKFFEYLNKLQRLRFGGLTATAAQRAEALLRTIGKWDAKTAQPEG